MKKSKHKKMKKAKHKKKSSNFSEMTAYNKDDEEDEDEDDDDDEDDEDDDDDDDDDDEDEDEDEDDGGNEAEGGTTVGYSAIGIGGGAGNYANVSVEEDDGEENDGEEESEHIGNEDDTNTSSIFSNQFANLQNLENRSESQKQDDSKEMNYNLKNVLQPNEENNSESFRYKNVFRVEVKLKNGKLNSNKLLDKKNGKENIRTKDLETYYNERAFNQYHYNFVKKIYGIEPFYRIDIAKNIIIESNISKNMKEKLCELLDLVNSVGYTEAEKIWSDTFSRATFYLHIKMIRNLGINILTFSKEIDGIKISYEMIPNFALLENSEFAE